MFLIDIEIIHNNQNYQNSIYLIIKRIFDIFIAFILIIVLFPLFIIVITIIKIEDYGCVFYVQKRVGKNNTIFNLYKFRSMTETKRNLSIQIQNESSDITNIGKIIRRYKIDELPQLFNVLKGDMSIVGPRPCLPETIKEFGVNSRIRHFAKPGLTGISQINGNTYLSWNERLAFDLQYIYKMTYWLDFLIIINTLFIIIYGEKWGKKK